MHTAEEHDFVDYFHREMPRLLRTAFALTGNQHDAWDLVQETMVRVASRWNRIRDQNPGGYGQTVLVRLNVDRLRAARREILGRLPFEGRDDRSVPVEMDTGRLDEDLLTALASLTRNERAAVALRFLDDLEIRRIGEILGCSDGTVRTHLSRGTAKLRAAYINLELDRTAEVLEHEQ